MDHLQLIYVTCPSATVARTIGRTLVEEHLAACVNVLPGMHSIYRWEGAIEEADEAVLLIKTTSARYDAVEARARQLHPYQVPCVLAVPVERVLAGYGEWLRNG